jgi:hypothetical protein
VLFWRHFPLDAVTPQLSETEVACCFGDIFPLMLSDLSWVKQRWRAFLAVDAVRAQLEAIEVARFTRALWNHTQAVKSSQPV